MRWPFRQLVVADPQTLLPPSAPSRTHRHLFFSRMHSHSTRHTDEHKLLQVTKQISRLAPRAVKCRRWETLGSAPLLNDMREVMNSAILSASFEGLDCAQSISEWA